jgi:hypothetical protein
MWVMHGCINSGKVQSEVARLWQSTILHDLAVLIEHRQQAPVGCTQVADESRINNTGAV